VVADEIDDREAVLAIPRAQPAAELLQEDDRRLGRAQHQHGVDLGHVEPFVEDVHAEHELEPRPLPTRRPEQIRLRVKARLRVAEHPNLQVRKRLGEIEQPRERGVLGDLEIVGREDPHARAALQRVLQRLINQLQPRAHNEADDQIDAVKRPVCKMTQQLLLKRPLLPVKQRDRLTRTWRRRPRRCKVVALAGNHVANPAAWVLDVAAVARDDMQMKVRDGLTGCSARIEPDIETVGRETTLDHRADVIDQRDQLPPLILGCLPPRHDRPPRDDERVPPAHREAIPDRECEPIPSDVLASRNA